jgi:endonuclease YncB( thermonuclease family)
MLGYDSCETHTKDLNEKMHGIATKMLLEDKILNKVVQLTFSAADKYGRWLATVTYNSENINEWIVQHSPSVAYCGKQKEKKFNYKCNSPLYTECLQKARLVINL